MKSKTEQLSWFMLTVGAIIAAFSVEEFLVPNHIFDCVVTRAEIFELKKIITDTEGSTFTTISEVSEIIGNHIKSK